MKPLVSALVLALCSLPGLGGGRGAGTRAQAVLVTVDDWADHYSQVAIYLRLNGHLPPTAKRGAQ